MKNLNPDAVPYHTELHLEQVCFDRVFDAQQGSTMFSFESGGKRQFGVHFAGGPVPVPGARYAVVLGEPGNWQKVLGCRDLATPDVYLRETVWGIVSEFAFLGYFVLPVVLGITLAVFGAWAALSVLVLSVWMIAAYLRHVQRRSRAIMRMLRAVPPQVPPGAGRDPNPTWPQRFWKAVQNGVVPWG